MIIMSILFVDDDPNTRIMAEVALQSDFDCYLAECGEAALLVAEYERPDLILLDLHLSGMDGAQTLLRLKQNQHTADIPVILMAHEGAALDAVNGTIAVWEKPLNLTGLPDRIRKLSDRL